jgi:PKD repeat protein
VYDRAGTYELSLTVFDQRGNNSATKSITVTADQSGGPSDQSFNLPPLAIGILTSITAMTILGSVFWLRKKDTKVQAQQTD